MRNTRGCRRGSLIPKPGRLSWTDAAAVPSALASIWRMLVTRARVQPGETVLIFGASGGTGSFAVQLVRAMGAVAIAVTSSERKEIFCHELGAHHVIRSDRDNVVQEVKRLTGRRGVDVVFDHAGENTWQLGVASLTWGGRLVICGATEGFNAKIDLRHLWNKQLSLLGSHAFTQGELMAAMRMVEDGRLRPFVTEVIGLQDLGDAQERMQRRQTLGKLAIEIAHG
ncbi:MAG: zinc-binding dehydrogenase [Aquabacterium sp.]